MTMDTQPRLLVVDDEPFNLDILKTYLEQDGYAVVSADDGDVALKILEEDVHFDVIILDRMMPRLDGLKVLEAVKERDATRSIPVIMQTAAASPEQIPEGITAGAYYYLTKPYEENVLLSLVRSALRDAATKKEIVEKIAGARRALGLMERSRFRFRTLKEARELANFLAGCFPDPANAAYGLTELMINAVEHGNLGISHAEKTQLINNNTWDLEIEKRLQDPDYKFKYVHVYYEVIDDYIALTIEDEGEGFDPQHFMTITPDRAFLPHGRGIAMTKMLAFAQLEYLGKGNVVRCLVPLNAGASL